MGFLGMFFQGGIFGFILFGIALYAFLSWSDYSVSQPKLDSMSDPGLGGGPWQMPTTSQMAVPIVFGTVRIPMPLVHYRLEGDQYRDMWLVACAGEQWSTLHEQYQTQLGTVWLNDYLLSQLPEYTTNTSEFDREHIWGQFYESGRGVTLLWTSTGKHVFVKHVPPGERRESYAMQCNVAGGVTCKVRMIHQFEPGGVTNTYHVKVVYISDVPQAEHTVFNGSVFKHATQTVKAGKSSETIEVGGTKESIHEIVLPYEGSFVVSVDCISSTNGGKLYLDSVELTDNQLRSETINTFGTSLFLMRVTDHVGDLARPIITGVVTGGPSNPAMALWWVLTDTELGLGMPEEALDFVSFSEAADKCDQYNYTFNRGYCNFTDFEEVIRDICAAGRLYLTEYNGKISCIFDEEVPAENVRVVDIDNCATKVEYGDASVQRIPNRFNIKYVDAKMDYAVQDLVLDDVILQDATRSIREQTIGLYGVTDQEKAWELGWYHAKWSQASKWLEFEMTPRLWDLIPTSVIKTTSTNDAYLDGKEWMVVGIEEAEPGKYKAKCIIYPREAYTPATYTASWPSVQIEDPWQPLEGSPNISPAVDITDPPEEFEHTADGKAIVNLSFTGFDSETQYVVIYRSYDGENYHQLTSINAKGKTTVTYEYIEDEAWTFIWYKFVAVKSWDDTAVDLGAVGRRQLYIPGVEENVPGYGLGHYGYQPFGY